MPLIWQSVDNRAPCVYRCRTRGGCWEWGHGRGATRQKRASRLSLVEQTRPRVAPNVPPISAQRTTHRRPRRGVTQFPDVGGGVGSARACHAFSRHIDPGAGADAAGRAADRFAVADAPDKNKNKRRRRHRRTGRQLIFHCFYLPVRKSARLHSNLTYFKYLERLFERSQNKLVFRNRRRLITKKRIQIREIKYEKRK